MIARHAKIAYEYHLPECSTDCIVQGSDLVTALLAYYSKLSFALTYTEVWRLLSLIAIRPLKCMLEDWCNILGLENTP